MEEELIRERKYLFPLGPGVTRRILKGHENNIPNIKISSCGKYIASCSIDATARVWNLRTGHQIALLSNSNRIWNWSVNFISPCTFLAPVLLAQPRLDLVQQPPWAPGIPDALKPRLLPPGTRRGRDIATGLDWLLSTTIVYDLGSESGEETLCFDSDVSSDDEERIPEEGSELDEQEVEETFFDASMHSVSVSAVPSSSASGSHAMSFDTAPEIEDEICASEDGVVGDLHEENGRDDEWATDSDNGGAQTGHLTIAIEEDDDEMWETDSSEGEQGDEYGPIETTSQSGHNTDEADESINEDDEFEDHSATSDEFWRQPSSIKTVGVSVLDTTAAESLGTFILYASITDLWVVDLQKQSVVCSLEGVFGSVFFGQMRVFDR
ncbi:hypothetical protein BC830DRAFT_599144 [Chytriomyces sp. MP71]|nr:hypothetical protein BC830DRAFT_599144 [Chytriomyces sp. MP71]